MKQSVNPAIAILCLVAAVGIAAFLGYRLMNASSATVETNQAGATAKPETINGQKVPDGVPYDYMTRSQGGSAPR